MASHNNTHPMLLIAAVALTLCSVLGSAVMAGLIPLEHYRQALVQILTDDTEASLANSEQPTVEENLRQDPARVVNARVVDTTAAAVQQHP
jgi:hypothetical protein